MNAKFITFEGIDGAGKSSHIEWFRDQLLKAGVRVVTTREPGGTEIGEILRNIILTHSLSVKSELLLILASRIEHINKLIKPNLASGTWVISDRFSDSTYAYQVGGRGIDKENYFNILNFCQGLINPDKTFLFDIDIRTAQERIKKNRSMDRFELEDIDFHQNVRDAYLELHALNESRIKLISSDQPMENIRRLLSEEINVLLS